MKLSHLIMILNRRQKRNFIILFFILLLGAFVELLGVGLVMPLANIVTDPAILKSNLYLLVGNLFGLETVNDYLIFFAAALIIIYVFKNLYIIVEYDLQYRFVYNSQRDLMKRMLGCYLKEDYYFHTQHNPMELQRNVLNDVETAFQALLALIQLMTELLVCGSLVAFLFYVDWRSTLEVFLIFVFCIIVFALIYKKYSYSLGVTVRDSNAQQLMWVHQSLSGIREIKVTDSESYFLSMFDKAARKLADSRRRQSVIGIIPKPILESVMICSLLGIIIIKVMLGDDVMNFIPMLTVFVMSAFRMLPSFNRITQGYNTLMYSKASVAALKQELEKMEQQKEQSTGEAVTCEEMFESDSNIRIENLCFAYGDEGETVLDDVNMIIPYKTSIAIIGESGSGKSTLADLILGILFPKSGKIMWGDRSIFDDMKNWHKAIGYIPQSIYLIDDTIARNIAFGQQDEEIDEERIWQVLREAQLEEFVAGLPEGLATRVGDRGTRLSGGQRQRIGIARALYNNPPIIIMDEATSSLDNETENAVMQSIDSMQGQRTIIIIAHRLTTIRNCKYIFRIENHSAKLVEPSTIFE